MNPIKALGLEVTEVDDGLVVFEPVQRKVHHLNATVAWVFERSTGALDEASIAAELQAMLGLDAPPLADVALAVQQLKTQSLVR